MTIDEMIAVLQAAKESSMKKSKQMARSAWRAYYHGSGWDIRIELADTMIRWHRSAKP